MSPRQLLVTTAQLVLLAMVVSALGIEEGAGLPSLIGWVVAGWVLHASSPPSWQPALFVAISLGLAVAKLGWDAPWVLLPALAIAELTAMPASLRVRAALVGVVAVGLAVLRSGQVPTVWPPLALATLGSMFMFRAVLVLLDPGGPEVSRWTRWGYFLQWPNVLFWLYPIVDWGHWRRAPATPPHELSQRGVRWVARGVLHLVGYRLVYHLGLPADWQIVDAGSALLWVLGGYGLYLRISGQFHVIVGFLLLFGRELPETHHLYFVASSFNDYWRRINIYWKDFVEKLVFYPFFLRVRRAGVPQPLVVSVLATFAATWALHAWQWFWLRGELLLTAPDTAYWALLGVLVAANSWWESTRPKKRGKQGKAHLRTAVTTAATFVALSILWSLWGSASFAEWGERMALFADPRALAAIAAALVGLVGLGTATLHLLDLPRVAAALATARVDRGGWGTLGSCAGVAAIAFVVTLPATGSTPVEEARAAVASEHLNEQDYFARTRGYYEELQPSRSLLGEAWQPERGFPAGWEKLTDTTYTVPEGTSLMYELAPSVGGHFHGAELTTNSHGMRDREYTLEKPPGTYRIALLGASIEMGGGIDGDDVFEQVVEDRLNRELAASTGLRFEILNFATDGYTLLHHVVQYPRKVRAFRPDLVIHAVHRGDGERILRRVARLARMGREIPSERLAEAAEEHAVKGMSEDDGTKALLGLEREATELLYVALAEQVIADGAKPGWLLVPQVRDIGVREPSPDWQRELAVGAGMVPLSAAGAYGERSAEEIRQAPWDDHPNTEGHHLVADRFYAELVAAAPWADR